MPSFEIWFRDFQKKQKATLLLAPLSWIFKGLVHARHRLYDTKVLKQKMSTACVVSIGNLVAGGVGKTQMVNLIASELSKTVRVAILSRGYRSKTENKKRPLLVNPLEIGPDLCGDEPWLLASKLKAAQVIVCKDRFLAAQEGERLKRQVLILDDGMQHRRLWRDFEIVMLDAEDPFGRGKFLPWGMLRDTPKRLKKADLIVSVGSLSTEHREAVSNLTEAPLVEAKIMVNGIQALDGSTIESIEGRNVAVFCGLGNPERFVKTVKNLGANVVTARFFPDHRKISEKDLLSFAHFSKNLGADLLLCTEKDKVKLSEKGTTEGTCPIGWISAKLEIEKNTGTFEGMMEKIKQLAGAV